MTPERLQLVDGELPDPTTTDPAPLAAAAERQLAFPNVAQWVQHLLLPQYARPTTSAEFRWCPYWWEHAEAMVRLEAGWRAWEHLRHEGATGPAVWWRDFGDPMMREVTSPMGPFFNCSYSGAGSPRNRDEVPSTWMMADPPPGLFDEPDGF